MSIQLHKIVLIFIRLTSFIVICPGFSFKGLPNILKVSLSMGISVLIYMVLPEMSSISSIYLFFFLTIKEVLFGLTIGYITNLIFSTIEIAGQLIDFQAGFSMASVFDPNAGSPLANYGKIFYWLSISVFFLTNMHHKIIETIIKSFEYVPLTTSQINTMTVEGILSLFAKIFELSLNLAAPIIIVLLLTDIVFGMISRTIPQINVFMLGMPLKAMISFFIMMLILSWLINSIGNIIGLIPDYLRNFFKIMS